MHKKVDTTKQNARHVAFGAIQADFQKIEEQTYDVVLQISSHKFLLHMTENQWTIDSFEILATKSFLEISKKSIHMMRSLTEQLRQKSAI